MPDPRTITFVTGTRAEFGLMGSTLRAIEAHSALRLRIVATGMHLDPAHGRTINDIRAAGFEVAATVPWKPAGADRVELARQTGLATARLAQVYGELRTDIVLVVGDRVEAFAAASAAHLSGHVVAHVHGGDRALGQVDDALRHAITKLAHLHFPATRESADRLRKLGEDPWRIKRVGSPGIDGIAQAAWPLDACARQLIKVDTTFRCAADARPLRPGGYVLALYHPTAASNDVEAARVKSLLGALDGLPAGVRRILLYPNNDPGSAGIVRLLDSLQQHETRSMREHFRSGTGSRRDAVKPRDSVAIPTAQESAWRPLAPGLGGSVFCRSLSRPAFLGLLRDAAVLIGNSSSGIIEAASFGTPVIDVGDRQKGRLHGPNVTHVALKPSAIRAALAKVWNNGRPRRFPKINPYGGGQTGAAIARHLAAVRLDDRLRHKLIAY